MEFDINRVYTSVNADELKVGSKVIVADSLAWLRRYVDEDRPSETLKRVGNDESQYRFIMTDESEYALAYLIEPPGKKKLKWTDLKIRDIVSNQTETRMVIGINTSGLVDIEDGCISHVNLGGSWVDDEELEQWEIVENED